ncbi:MAG: prepilin-type N-terminal cleavage/methylation domain-containing protein [Acidobacteria bacterium]|nr:prepilin-type N-terminal cleavage/methylation domain-containing protein [Acidobacteriota bacterium]MBV9478049.1 prepilin-type N-terminal cleavage/methylation domain-containing protein [Acidobacteriota bacterium]
MENSQNGQTLAELIVAVAIAGMLAGVVVPAFASLASEAALKQSVSRVTTLMTMTREHAMALQTHCAVRFQNIDGTWLAGVYEDGDGDGVLVADIAQGIDRKVRGPEVLFAPHQGALPGFIRGGVRGTDGTWIAADENAVRYGTSLLCSFGPNGSASPGSLYLHSGDREALVRTSDSGDWIRILYYDALRQQWSF